jgi:hypothetical protein
MISPRSRDSPPLASAFSNSCWQSSWRRSFDARSSFAHAMLAVHVSRRLHASRGDSGATCGICANSCNHVQQSCTQTYRYGKKTPGGAGTYRYGKKTPGGAGNTRDTRTHKGTRTAQTNLTTIQTHTGTCNGRGVPAPPGSAADSVVARLCGCVGGLGWFRDGCEVRLCVTV